MWEVGCPEGDGTVLVSEMDNGVVEVLGHGCACTEFGSVFDDQLASGSILVFKIAGVSLREQKNTYYPLTNQVIKRDLQH